jgi:hypothetical protein
VAAAFIACMTGMPSHRPTADLHPVTRGGHVEGSTKAGLCPHEPGTGPVQPARAIKAKSARSVTVDCVNLARSRCRAARRRLQAGRRRRREQVSGYGPVRPRLERVPSGGGGAFLEECLGELSGPGSQRVHAAKARQPRQDVHGRGMPSKDVLFSVGSRHGAGLSEPDLAPSGVLRGFGRTTEILNGMTVMTWLLRSTECAAPGISQAKGVIVIMKGMPGGRSAAGRRATRCGSRCRAAAGGVPGERSARTSSAPSTAAIPARPAAMTNARQLLLVTVYLRQPGPAARPARRPPQSLMCRVVSQGACHEPSLPPPQ